FCYGSDTEAARETQSAVEAEGAKDVAVQADVSDPAAGDAAVGEVEAAFGKVTILVNNAGIARDGLVARMSDEQWRTVIDTHLTRAFHTIRPATLGMMRERYGRIVNVASVAGQSGQAGQANYAAAKAGLLGLSRSIARE